MNHSFKISNPIANPFPTRYVTSLISLHTKKPSKLFSSLISLAMINIQIVSVVFLVLFLCLFSGHNGEGFSDRHRPRSSTKLFVFGDSYADTGNIRKSVSSSWNFPYGITFPGKPAGRFSDGRVSTDFLANVLGTKTPMPYIWRNLNPHKHFKYGMNFAYGGTGVFDTLVSQPNMTSQIGFFQQLLRDGAFTAADLSTSVALVSVAGNDYSTYLARNGSAQGFQAFISQVVNQLCSNLKRIHSLGVKKIVVQALQPLGCLPRSTVTSSFQQCNGTQNLLVSFHNGLLQQTMAELNNQTKESTFIVLDLYKAFITVIKNKGEHPGSLRFENPLKPCCVGISKGYSCGSIDENGSKKYTICNNPKSAFFWDNVHPTQEGWRSVYSVLNADLAEISKN